MPIAWNNPELSVLAALQPLALADMAAQGERSTEMLRQVRNLMLAPDAVKEPPVFSADVLANLCGVTKGQFDYRIKSRPDMPAGAVLTRGGPRRFTLKEARTWIREYRPAPPRAPGEEALVLTVANTKGGVGKTTTAFALAQGLSLRSYQVLLVDNDPQSSATTLTGTVPEKDVAEADTILPYLFGDKPDLRYAVKETYWDGLDIIPSNTLTYSAELKIPGDAARGRARLWDRLVHGLAPLKPEYDVIIIDTAPALSFLTLNALFAADGLLVPVPPTALDYAAGAQFWKLFGDLADEMEERSTGDEELRAKRWAFVYVLPTHATPGSQGYSVVRDWMARTYGDKVFPGEIVRSKVAETLSAEFKTVYDIVRYEGNAASYMNLRAGYDRLAEVMDYTLVNARQAMRG